MSKNLNNNYSSDSTTNLQIASLSSSVSTLQSSLSSLTSSVSTTLTNFVTSDISSSTISEPTKQLLFPVVWLLPQALPIHTRFFPLVLLFKLFEPKTELLLPIFNNIVFAPTKLHDNDDIPEPTDIQFTPIDPVPKRILLNEGI